MQCPRCQEENPAQAKFCLECGSPFEPTRAVGASVSSRGELRRELTDREQRAAIAEIRRVIWALPYCIAVLAVALELVLILRLNAGRFTYTLDDPYIHLALSEQVFRLHYGINAEEPSSPSSSIIFPLLLAPFAPFRVHEYLPLVLNILALFAGIRLIAAVARRAGLDGTPPRTWFGAGLVTLIALALNHVGLVFTGMEHSVHVMVTLAVVLGLVVVVEEGRLPWWLLAAIVAGPLVRYEAAAVSAGALIVLAIRGRWRPAVTAALACGTLVAIFSVMLLALGLPALPSSVLAKSEVVSTALDQLSARGLYRHLLNLISAPSLSVVLLAQGVVLMVARFLVQPRWRLQERETLLTIFAVVVAGAHLAAGHFGWFGRYEIYAVSAVAVVAVYLWRRPLGDLVDRTASTWALTVVAAPLFLVAGPAFFHATLFTPRGANNIYEQQYQMHRFVTECHRGPVAVNDLGWVAYRNPYYVLDLSGLGSEAARRAQQGKTGTPSPEWIRNAASHRGVGLAMIYDQWFRGAIPPEWIRVAELHLGHRHVTPAEAVVTFYVTDQGGVARTLDCLRRFRKTLPPGVQLAIFEPHASPLLGGFGRNSLPPNATASTRGCSAVPAPHYSIT